MRDTKKGFIVVVVCLIILVITVAPVQSKKRHQLIYVESEYPYSLDSITSYQTSEIRLMELLFNSLVRRGDGDRTIYELAEEPPSPEAQHPGANIIRFRLRQNITWKDDPNSTERAHNTIRPQDVEKTVQLLFANPDSISHPNLLIYLGGPNAVTVDEKDNSVIEFNVRQVPGKLENVFTFKILPFMFFRRHPSRLEYGSGLLYETGRESFHSKPFGTGMYKVKRFQAKECILVRRAHQNLLPSRPRLEEIIMQHEPDANAALALLSQDAVDMVPEALPKSAQMFQDTGGQFSIDPYWNNQFYFIGFNFDGDDGEKTPQRKLLSDRVRGQTLRQAMSLATDKFKIMTEVYWNPQQANLPPDRRQAELSNEAGVVSEGPLNRYNGIKDIKPRETRPYGERLIEAKRLLNRYFDLDTYSRDDLDWQGESIHKTRDGRSTPLEFDLVYNGERGDLGEVARRFQTQMRAIHIKINLHPLKKGRKEADENPRGEDDDWEYRVYQEHDFDLILDFYTFPTGTDDFTPLYSHYVDDNGEEQPMRQNLTGYNNDEVTRLIQQYRTESNPTMLPVHLQTLYNTLRDDYAMIYLFVLNTNAVYHKRVKNVEVQNYYFFKNVQNWDVVPE